MNARLKYTFKNMKAEEVEYKCIFQEVLLNNNT